MTRSASSLILASALFFAGLGAAGQFAKIGVIFDYISEAYSGSSGLLLGLMVSGVGLPGLIFGSTAGILLARAPLKLVMIISLAVAAVLSLIQASMPSIPVFLGLRVIEGFSHLAIVVCAPVIIAETLNGKDRAFALTLWSTFFAVCFAFMAWAGRPLVAVYGIPSLFIAHAIYMAAMAFLMIAVLAPDEKRETKPLNFSAIIRRHCDIYASPWVAAPALGFMFYTAMYVAILSLLPPMTGAWQGFIATAVPLVSIAASLTLGSYLIARHSAVLIVQGGFAMATVATLMMWLGWSVSAIMVSGTLLLSAAVGLVQSASFAAIAELNDTHESRSAATGAIAQLGNVGTTSGTPILAALISAYGINGLGAFTLLLSLGGIAVHQWLKWRRS